MRENLQCLEYLKIHVMNSVAGEIFAALASEEFQPLDIILYSVSRILEVAHDSPCNDESL